MGQVARIVAALVAGGLAAGVAALGGATLAGALGVHAIATLGVYGAGMLFARPAISRAPAAPASAAPADFVSVELLADPVLLVGADWRVAAANAAARELLGDRIAGGDLRLVLRHPAVLDTAALALAEGGPALREVSGLGRAEGVYRLRAVRAPAGMLLSFTDVTQARLAERMRVDFVANASHELRTPLATIGGFIETLLGPAADDEAARGRFLAIMAREAARMSRLIDDLLSLSRIELDKYVRPQLAVELPPLIGDVRATLAMRLEADGRLLRVEAPEKLPAVIADRDQVLQVMHNLVSNALKYGRAGTPITLSVSVVDDHVRLAVRDEGEGIAPEHLPRLTERFYRVDTSRSRSMGGTGLGLAIVKHIVERHRGALEITSRQGVGSEVSFTLPVAPFRPAQVSEGAVTKASS